MQSSIVLRRIVPLWTVLLLLGLSSSVYAQAERVTFEFPAHNHTWLYEEMAIAFEKEHPNIDVELVPHSWTGTPRYAEELLVKAAGDIMSDVILVPIDLIRPFVDQGLFVSLDPYIERDRADLDYDDIIPEALSGGIYKDQHFGLPIDMGLVMFTYNIDAFNEAGLTTPNILYENDQWTFDAVRDIARRLTLRDAQGNVQRWGMFFQFDAWFLQGWVAGYGGTIYDADTNRLHLNEKGAMDALEFLRSLMVDEHVATHSGGLGNHVSAGRVVLNPWNHNVTSNYRDWNAPFAYDQVPFAAGPVSSRTTPANGVVLVLTSRSQNPDAAWEFLKWMTKNAASFPGYTEYFGDMPARLSQLMPWIEQRVASGITGAVYHLNAADDIFVPDPIPPEVQDVVKRAIGPIFRGEQSVETAMASATEQGNAILKELESR